MPRTYPSAIERLIANSVLAVDHFFNGTPCWVWIGTRKTNRDGKQYGTISVREHGKVKKELVHRWVLRTIKGRRLTPKNVGRHLCNFTLCCAPLHLVGGTQISNVRQCVREGRHGNAYRAPVTGISIALQEEQQRNAEAITKAFEYRPPLDANKRPSWLDRPELDLDCVGGPLKPGT